MSILNCEASSLGTTDARALIDSDLASRGDTLSADDQSFVKSAFVHRYTRDWMPQWVEYADEKLPVQFDSDEQWLRYSYFAVDDDGAVLREHGRCYSVPQFPDGRRVSPWEQMNLELLDEQGEIV